MAMANRVYEEAEAEMKRDDESTHKMHVKKALKNIQIISNKLDAAKGDLERIKNYETEGYAAKYGNEDRESRFN